MQNKKRIDQVGALFQNWLSLVAVVSEGFVGFSHFVSFVFLLH
jgi:hypothetical protein